MKLIKDSTNENLIILKSDDRFYEGAEYLPPLEALQLGARLTRWATDRIEAIESDED